MVYSIFSILPVLIWIAFGSTLCAHIPELDLEAILEYNARSNPLSSDFVKNTILPTPYMITCADDDFAYEVTSQNFYFVFENTGQFPKSDNLLLGTFERYRSLIFYRLDAVDATPSGKQVEMTVRVRLPSDDVTLNIDTNESYTININQPNTIITAKTVYGAMRAIETLSQLVIYHEKRFLLYKCNVTDRPKFQYRGFLIETSNHFLPLSIIKVYLDTMQWYKMNILHWHVVDKPAFPYASKAFPSLSAKGAYTQREIYSISDVQDIIDYAAMRGIRVIPEFDTPGHTESWGDGVPGLLTECYNTATGKPDGSYGPINPISYVTWLFLEKFYTEIGKVFPDTFMHLGGDEVPYNCWQTNPDIQAWMQDESYTDYSKLEAYYFDRLTHYVTSVLKRKVMVWQEVFDNKLNISLDSIIHVWKSVDWNYRSELEAITKAGYTAILSSCWYLDDISTPPHWMDYYNCDPLDFNGTTEMKSRVLGGEACAWTDYMDATNYVSRIWPRALGAAERLWSINNTMSTDFAVVYSRLHPNRCRLLARGIEADPLGPGYCDYEWVPLLPKLKPQ